MSDQHLVELLRAGADFDPYYGAQLLSDHLPMALLSLHRLGAGDHQVDRFREKYATRLEQQRYPLTPLPTDPWLEARGEQRFYPALRVYFEQILRRDGVEEILRAWMPRLIGSLGCDAFHPAIRVALAVDSGCVEEIACGLAYWVSAWSDIPVSDGARASHDLTTAFASLAQHPALAKRRASNAMFGVQLDELSARAEFRELVRWRSAQIDLKALIREAARIYLSTQLFFTLHMVTGAQAAHALAPYVNDDDRVADALWMSLAGAYLILRSPRYDAESPRQRPLPPPGSVLRAALAADDEHIAKLAYSAFVEWRAFELPEHAAILHAIADGSARLAF